jgi:hypothetical protein
VKKWRQRKEEAKKGTTDVWEIIKWKKLGPPIGIFKLRPALFFVPA